MKQATNQALANNSSAAAVAADLVIIHAIAERACSELSSLSADWRYTLADVYTTVKAAHNAAPLRLADLLAADLANFSHDIAGMLRYWDYLAGRFVGGFVPRFELELKSYEIYVCNSEPITTGLYAGAAPGTVAGWDIKFVKTVKPIESYPFFDCVITKGAAFEECELF